MASVATSSRIGQRKSVVARSSRSSHIRGNDYARLRTTTVTGTTTHNHIYTQDIDRAGSSDVLNDLAKLVFRAWRRRSRS